MKIKGIFFDLYGTLLIYNNMSEAWSEWFSVFYNCMKKFGMIEISKDKFANHCEGFFGKDEPTLQNDNLTLYEHRIQALGINLGLELEIGEIQYTATSCVSAWQKYVTLDPNTKPVLNALKKNKKIALISNFDHPPHIKTLLSDMGLNEYFDSITISGSVGYKKPDPLIFSFALQQTDLNPNEVVYVGDTNVDVEGALAAKIFPILIQREESSLDSKIMDYNLNKESNHSNEQGSTLNNVKKISSLLELITLYS